MELSFIVAAIRRYLWVVYLTAMLGLAAGLLIPASRADSFSATSSLQILPAAENPTDPERQGDPRYIQSQKAILESENLAVQVADRLGIEFADVEDTIEVVTDAASDVVVLTATAGDADSAIAIVNGYASQFIENRRTAIRERNDGLVTIIDAQIEQLNIEAQEQEAERSRYPANPETDEERIIVGNIAQRLTSLNTQIAELQSQRTSLVVGADSTNRDAITQTAFQAVKQGTNSPLLTVAGTFAGLLLGIAIVVTYAGTSGRLLDTVALEEALGAPVVGIFARASSFLPGGRRIKTPITALEALPDRCVPVIDELCVRTEAAAPGPGTLLVVVTGSRDPAATTTTTLAMAGRLAVQGSRVLVVDADFADPRITDALVGDHPGLTDLLEERERLEAQNLFGPDGSATPEALSAARSTLTRLTLTHEQTRVGVVGIGTRGVRRNIPRADEDFLIQALRNTDVDVVLVDAGPMLKSSAGVRLAQAADVTVLAVPYRRQDVEPLRVVRRLLSEAQGTVLPLATEPR